MLFTLLCLFSLSPKIFQRFFLIQSIAFNPLRVFSNLNCTCEITSYAVLLCFGLFSLSSKHPSISTSFRKLLWIKYLYFSNLNCTSLVKSISYAVLLCFGLFSLSPKHSSISISFRKLLSIQYLYFSNPNCTSLVKSISCAVLLCLFCFHFRRTFFEHFFLIQRIYSIPSAYLQTWTALRLWNQ